MSDEFIRVATEEIKIEIGIIDKIINSCTTDADIIKNTTSLQSSFHKIKGLAPMMNHGELGKIASLFDTLLSSLSENNPQQGVYNILEQSNTFMKNAINDATLSSERLQHKIKNEFSDVFQ